MAAEKNITSRIQQRHDTAANWANATTFIPKKGEIVVYDAEYNTGGVQTQAVRFKIGDGSRTINNLPFALIDYDTRIASLESTVNGLGTAAQKDVGFFATAAQGTKADNAVPKTRKVNNKALSADITLGASDVGVTETAFPGLKKTGTITGIKMNGTSKGTSGVVDLGTVITAHQDISGKQDKITSTNKLAASLVSGLATVATSGSYNDLSNKPTIPAAITESTVSGWGFTKNKGTVTSVAVKMNGSTKGTITSSGTIDLGTVITSHQDISGKANLTGGNAFTGKQTLTGAPSDGYSIDATGYIKGSWLQSSVKSNKGSGTGMVCVFDSNGWIYYRTPSEILTEAGGAKASDIPTFELSGDTLIINF